MYNIYAYTLVLKKLWAYNLTTFFLITIPSKIPQWNPDILILCINWISLLHQPNIHLNNLTKMLFYLKKNVLLSANQFTAEWKGKYTDSWAISHLKPKITKLDEYYPSKLKINNIGEFQKCSLNAYFSNGLRICYPYSKFS